MLNGFCLSSNPPPTRLLFLTENIKWMENQPKSNEKYTSFLHCISSFGGYFLQKLVRYNHQIFYFLLFHISFYISRYHFLQIFKTFIQHYLNKIFSSQIFLLMDSLKPPCPYPLNSRNPLSVAKSFCWCSLKACVRYFFSFFYFFINWYPFKNWKQCFLFHLKSSFRCRDILIFVNFSLLFHTFHIQNDKWKWNNLWCHEFTCIHLQV